MGIIINIPSKKYKCSNCGSMQYEQFSEPPETQCAGHYEGVRCLNCKHEHKRYVRSIYELETDGASWSTSSEHEEF